MEKKKKEHADFQNEYSQSSNFGKKSEDSNLKAEGDGNVKLQKNETSGKSEKENVRKIIDDLSDEK